MSEREKKAEPARGKDFMMVNLKAGVGSVTIHDGRLAIHLEGPGPHRVTRAEWEHSRELRQYAEEVISPQPSASKPGPAGP